jgi:hypothetical protein
MCFQLDNRIMQQFELLPNIRSTASVAEAVTGAAVVLLCLPAQIIPGEQPRLKGIKTKDDLFANLAVLSQSTFCLDDCCDHVALPDNRFSGTAP